MCFVPWAPGLLSPRPWSLSTAPNEEIAGQEQILEGRACAKREGMTCGTDRGSLKCRFASPRSGLILSWISGQLWFQQIWTKAQVFEISYTRSHCFLLWHWVTPRAPLPAPRPVAHFLSLVPSVPCSPSSPVPPLSSPPLAVVATGALHLASHHPLPFFSYILFLSVILRLNLVVSSLS